MNRIIVLAAIASAQTLLEAFAAYIAHNFSTKTTEVTVWENLS